MATPTINATSLTPIVAGAITSDYQATIYDQAGNAGRAAVADIVSAANAVNGCVCVQTVKLDIPTAEVLTLNTTPKPFGLTVPSGYYVQPLAISFRSVYGTTPYATNTSLRIRPIGSAESITAQAINYSADIFAIMGFSGGTAGQLISDVDLEVYVNTGDPTAGDSDITLYLTYALIEL